MSRSIPELTYDPAMDADVFMWHSMQLGGVACTITAATVAGRREPYGPRKVNEDAFSVVTPEDAGHQALVAAVFDGASSRKKIAGLRTMTGARYASQTLARLLRADTLDEADMGDLLCGLNERLGASFAGLEGADATDLNSLPTSTGTLLRVDTKAYKISVGHVGDTFAIAELRDGSTVTLSHNQHRKFDDQILARVRGIADYERISPREARGDPSINLAIMDMFTRVRNAPLGVEGEGILNGDPNMNPRVYRNAIDLSEVKSVLIGSDGLVPPGMDEHNPADRRLMLSKGLAGLIGFVQEVQDGDPDRELLRYADADDTTGVHIDFEN